MVHPVHVLLCEVPEIHGLAHGKHSINTWSTKTDFFLIKCWKFDKNTLPPDFFLMMLENKIKREENMKMISFYF